MAGRCYYPVHGEREGEGGREKRGGEEEVYSEPKKIKIKTTHLRSKVTYVFHL